MGLQQKLYGSRFTALPVRERSERSTPSLSSQPSQFHSCEETIINDDLSDYHESKIHLLPFCHYLPHLWARLGILLLSAMTKMISTVCSVAQVIMRCDQHSLPLCYNFFIVKTVLIDATFTLTALNTSVTTASCMPCIIANPTARTIETGDFNPSGR
jgi:hypothetical protein